MTKKANNEVEFFIDQSNLPVPVENILEGNAQDVFIKENGLMPYYKHVKEQVKGLAFDANTEEGRKAMIGLSRKISKSKTLIENPAREWLKNFKASVKPAEFNINQFPKLMDALRDEVKRPADEWQAEQDRIAKVKQDVIDCFGLVVANAKEQLPHMLPATAMDQIKIRIADVKNTDISAADDRIEEAKTAQQDCLVTLAGYLSIAEKEVHKAEQAEADRITEIERVATENAIKANASEMRRMELNRDEAIQQAAQERADSERRVNYAAQQARDEERAAQALASNELMKSQEMSRVSNEIEKPSDDYIKTVNNATGTALCGLGLTVDQAKAVMKAAKIGKLGGLQMVY